MINVTHQISAVSRQVGARTLEAGEARVITIAQAYPSTVDDVWDACTNPERIPRWFLPVTGELRLGGRYQLEGNAGGTIERCDPPKGFAATWEFAGQVSWIELRLSADPDGGTRFELDHIVRVDDHWAQFGPGAVGIGWDLALIGLTGHLSAGPALDPADGAAWMASTEGREFMTRSGERWLEAHLASGADPTEARESASRTAAAYTGTAEEPA
jgi:uncharacterized protein YndB with AHSA1/START domain